MATPLNRNGFGALVSDRNLASTAAPGGAAPGLNRAVSGGPPLPTSRIEPVLESALTPAHWLQVARFLEARAAELEVIDLEIARIYRRDAVLIRTRWSRN